MRTPLSIDDIAVLSLALGDCGNPTETPNLGRECSLMRNKPWLGKVHMHDNFCAL